MRKITKRVFTALLTLVMLLTAVPIGAFAQNSNGENGELLTETYAEGANSVGNVIADVIDEAQDEAQDNATALAGISALELNGFTASVNFFTDTEAKLVVAVYTEDSKQMLTSGMVNVTAEETTATVSINEVTLPDYYLVRAFLLDSATNAALCDKFTDDTHTKAYIDFMAVEATEFDENRVIYLDETVTDNNFIVVSENAEIVSGSESVNVLVSADYDTNTYVFENIDSSISSLNIGDIFYFNSYSEQYEIIKVKSIQIDGTTATIVSDEMEVKEAFEFVKIDSADFDEPVEADSDMFETSAVEYDDSKIFMQGTFDVDLRKNSNGKIRPIIKSAIYIGESKETLIDQQPEKNSTSIATAKANVTLKADIKIYISWSYSKIDFSIIGTAGITIDAKIAFSRTIQLGDFYKGFKKILVVGVKLNFVIDFTVTINVTGTLTFTQGIKYSTKEGFSRINQKPSFIAEVKIDGDFYIGFELVPYANVVGELVAEAEVPLSIGIQITANFLATNVADENHSCSACLAGTINIKIGFSASVSVLGGEPDTIPEKAKTFKITDFYYSVTHNQFGLGTCPYKKSSGGSSSGGSTGGDSSGGGSTGGDSSGDDWEDDEPIINVGDIVEFGSYPQSKVTDSATLSALNTKSLSWQSYGYYSGTGDYGTMTASDYMKYADVTYNGEKYRVVKFTSYRPCWTQKNSSASYSDQYDNGYKTNTTYWFKYDPIYWRVLEPNDGLIMSETIIDSQAYSDTIYYYSGEYYNNSSYTNYANDYATSSIREWLNDDFYNTAFTSNQKSKIKTTELDNSAYSSSYSKYDSATTNDKVFLLSWNEAHNAQYGFGSSDLDYDIAKTAKGSDYAKCQGLYVYKSSELDFNGNSFWLLRSPSGVWDSESVCGIYADGDDGDCFFYVNSTSYGVRPALKISHLESLMSASFSEGEYLETETLETQSTETTEVIAGTETSFTVNTCLADGRYTLLNVTGYGEDFGLNQRNMLYIDVLNADSYGNLTVDFTPMRDDETATTLLIGDFGSGTEAKDPGNVTASITGVTYEQSKDTHNTFSVTVDGRPAMIQFIEPDGGTRTYDRNNKNVSIKSYDANGNEINSLDRTLSYEVWEIYSNMSTDVQIKTRAKYLNDAIYTWDKVTYNFTVKLLAPDGAVRSVTPAAESGRFGAVETIVVTGPDAEAIRFKMEDGSTSTYYASKATVLENGDLSFTGKAWMNTIGMNTVEVYVKVDGKWQYVTEFDYEANDYPITA